MRPFRSWTLLLGFLSCSFGLAQQVPDTAFLYKAATPAYAKNKGPVIVLDEAHFNFHTLGGRYSAFGRVLADDGYVLRPGTEQFTPAALAGVRILVMANALPDTGEWRLPTASAVTPEECAAVEQWVSEGGSLFIIADHMPFGGAAADLAAVFGFNWVNGFAFRKDEGPEFFSRKAGNLLPNAVTNGADPGERIDSIKLFTGSAFLAPPEATIVTSLLDDYQILLPTHAWQFSDTTAQLDGKHFVNGALLPFGKGRVVCFGEAAMFSAQLAGPKRKPAGMNAPGAEQNPQLLLNLIHWLDHRL
ncbi:MAG: hypothetical protein QM724_13100 [Flavobacteriales bacterium]